jgi:hypothetical protein
MWNNMDVKAMGAMSIKRFVTSNPSHFNGNGEFEYA